MTTRRQARASDKGQESPAPTVPEENASYVVIRHLLGLAPAGWGAAPEEAVTGAGASAPGQDVHNVDT
jgi:hypothetical protein